MKNLFAAVAFGALTLTASAAWAGQTLVVEVDRSQILTLPAAPGAIVVGNPAIADVTIQGQQIFIHGRGFGQTNLTILDLQGNQIADFDIVGTHSLQSSLIVYRGGARYTYACAPYCESQAQIGDEATYFGNVVSQASGKFKLATGNGTAEAVGATPAPQ